MSKTYEKHEAGKRVAMLLKIVLFRKDNDTVFTTDFDHRIGALPGAKPKVKRKKQELRFEDQKKEDDSSKIFMLNAALQAMHNSRN